MTAANVARYRRLHPAYYARECAIVCARSAALTALRRLFPADFDRDLAARDGRRVALAALAALHPAEFRELHEAERAFRGVTDAGLERPCPCGGTVRRRTVKSRWPLECDQCKERGNA
jgi:hypothetical protein